MIVVKFNIIYFLKPRYEKHLYCFYTLYCLHSFPHPLFFRVEC